MCRQHADRLVGYQWRDYKGHLRRLNAEQDAIRAEQQPKQARLGPLHARRVVFQTPMTQGQIRRFRRVMIETTHDLEEITCTVLRDLRLLKGRLRKFAPYVEGGRIVYAGLTS